MFKSFGDLLESSSLNKKKNRDIGSAFAESDLKYLIQNWLRNQLQNDAIYCDKVDGGRVSVRVGSPAGAQAIKLAEYELIEYVRQDIEYEVKGITVVIDI